ncbi:MAG: zf-HC2 domain-containing protein [Lachnospiraceae bacterium]|nr:zf-HC2 domain-containing protein [Lachnospiraceae bacterium]
MLEKAKDDLSCKEIRALIPDYLSKNLALHDAKLFTGHLRKCRDCREELEISYLLDQGLKKVEDGESVDLHEDLNEMLEETEDSIQSLSQFDTAVHLVESTAVFVLIACVFILWIYYTS